MAIDERPLLGRLRREPARAVVHPDHEPVIGRGDDIEIPIEIDVGGHDMPGIDVILQGNCARERCGIGGAGRRRYRRHQHQRQSGRATQRAGTHEVPSIIAPLFIRVKWSNSDAKNA